MTAVLWGIAVIASAAGLFAIHRLIRLQRELNQLKREHYYTSSRVKRIPEDIKDAVQPMRLHLAKVAEGGMVPREMILDGRLYQDLAASDAQRVLEQESGRQSDRIVFLDVRSPKEYATKRVPGAKLMSLDELDKRYAEVPQTAEKVIVYCAGGERSRFACDFLSQRGYTNLYHIREGLQGWQGPIEGEAPVSLVQIDRKVAPTP